MKQLTCEMCGSTDLIKDGGVFVCQTCGCKYSIEEAKRMMIEIDNSKQIENLYKLARREIQMNDHVKAKEYYDQILVENPEDWEASFFSIIGKAYGITRGQVPSAVNELVSNIPIAIKMVVSSTDNVEKRRENLDIIVSQTVETYTYLKANYVFGNDIQAGRNFGRLVVACVSDMGYQIQKLGRDGELGESAEYNKLVAKALKWRTEYALSAPAMFDEATRRKYASELADVDPNYVKPVIQASPACYVATAVYGSYDCPQVWTLRRYRDYTLAETWYGRAFVHTYYAISPALVRWFGHTDWFKNMWRGKLDRMVSDLQSKGVESTPYEDREW